MLTAYLTENYISRVGAPVTDIDPADFPAEALRLFSTIRVPERDVRDGYRKRPFQRVMENLQGTRMAGTDPDRQSVSSAIPMPMLDYPDFCTHVGASIAEYLDPDKGVYVLPRLLVDSSSMGSAVGLAHETAQSLSWAITNLSRTAVFPKNIGLQAAADATALGACAPNSRGFSFVRLLSSSAPASTVRSETGCGTKSETGCRNEWIIRLRITG